MTQITSLMPTTPLNPGALVTQAVTLYAKTFTRTLPFVSLMIGIHFLIGILPQLPFIPSEGQINVLFMMGSILLLPIVGGFIFFQRGILTVAQTLETSLITSFRQLVALLLSLVYLSFIPLILMTIGVASFLFLDPEKVNDTIRLGILLSTATLTLLFLANKILAPLFVVLEKEDANTAQEHVAKLTKGSYTSTLILGLIPMLILVGLFWVPTVLNIIFSDVNIPFGYVVFQGAGDALLAIIGPLMTLVILLHINDLSLRKKGQFESEQKTMDQQYKDAALKSKPPSDESMF
ncbi:MAG: hypothetical protein U1E78_05760 [Gammaproteobacteria bacterium]